MEVELRVCYLPRIRRIIVPHKRRINPAVAPAREGCIRPKEAEHADTEGYLKEEGGRKEV